MKWFVYLSMKVTHTEAVKYFAGYKLIIEIKKKRERERDNASSSLTENISSFMMKTGSRFLSIVFLLNYSWFVIATPFTKPGEKYMDHNYVRMRIFCASMRPLIVPFCFIETYDLTSSLVSATFASSILLLDVDLVTISQYILLDPLLLCFICASFMGSSKLSTQQLKPFSLEWAFWLAWTGFFLASSVSVNFVGLFIVFKQ